MISPMCDTMDIATSFDILQNRSGLVAINVSSSGRYTYDLSTEDYNHSRNILDTRPCDIIKRFARSDSEVLA